MRDAQTQKYMRQRREYTSVIIGRAAGDLKTSGDFQTTIVSQLAFFYVLLYAGLAVPRETGLANVRTLGDGSG